MERHAIFKFWVPIKQLLQRKVIIQAFGICKRYKYIFKCCNFKNNLAIAENIPDEKILLIYTYAFNSSLKYETIA